jgi:hypothetical protein
MELSRREFVWPESLESKPGVVRHEFYTMTLDEMPFNDSHCCPNPDTIASLAASEFYPRALEYMVISLLMPRLGQVLGAYGELEE